MVTIVSPPLVVLLLLVRPAPTVSFNAELNRNSTTPLEPAPPVK